MWIGSNWIEHSQDLILCEWGINHTIFVKNLYVRYLVECIEADFNSVGFSEQIDFHTLKCFSSMTIYSNLKQNFIIQTKDFQPAQKILLNGNQP